MAESAALASTFQLPSVVNPLNNPKRLLARRDWVLGQMLSNRFITKAEYDAAINEPNDAFPHEQQIEVDAPYLAEMVRQQVLEKFGNEALTEGYVVHTTGTQRQPGRRQRGLARPPLGLRSPPRLPRSRGPRRVARAGRPGGL